MAKDSFWFKHDSGAGRDLKLQEITIIYSHWGKGIFWDVVETLREQDGYKFEISKLKMLCRMILCEDYIKFKNWYDDCIRLGLFVEENGYFYSESLVIRMENWESKKSNGSKGGRPLKTETITELKPKRNQVVIKSENRNETIREDKIREENKYVYNKFYDEQIKNAKLNNSAKYQTFVKFLFGNNINNRRLDKVLNLKDQISCKRLDELLELYSVEKIRETIISLDNYNKKTYTSFNSTLTNWLKK